MAASGFASFLSAQHVCVLQSDCNGDKCRHLVSEQADLIAAHFSNLPASIRQHMLEEDSSSGQQQPRRQHQQKGVVWHTDEHGVLQFLLSKMTVWLDFCWECPGVGCPTFQKRFRKRLFPAACVLHAVG